MAKSLGFSSTVLPVVDVHYTHVTESGENWLYDWN